ncbi:MAG: FecR family protein [Mucilaginibacter sp.]
MTRKEFLELLDKYLAGNASAGEEQFLFDVYQSMEDKYEWSQSEMAALSQLENRMIARFREAVAHSSAAGQPGAGRIVGKWFGIKVVHMVAASLLILFTVGGLYWVYQRPYIVAGKLFVDKGFKNLVTHTNNTTTTEKLIFPDQSSVELAPGTRIIYDRDFYGSLRQVYLSGEGFFRVTKNHAKPFIVYTDDVVAKVLGTSFIVKSGLTNTPASVVVRTGKVAVFKASEFKKENTTANFAEGVVLLPNHSADLGPGKILEKKLSASPEPLQQLNPNSFDFDNTPLPAVFSRLQESYGIRILYDAAKFSSCSLTVNMGKENFYQKMDLICRTMNASYQVRNGDVFVSGAGCGVNR